MIDTDPARLETKLAQVDGARRSTPDDIAGQLNSLKEIGGDHVILSLRAPYNHDDLALFAREVIPATR